MCRYCGCGSSAQEEPLSLSENCSVLTKFSDALPVDRNLSTAPRSSDQHAFVIRCLKRQVVLFREPRQLAGEVTSRTVGKGGVGQWQRESDRTLCCRNYVNARALTLRPDDQPVCL